MSWRQGRMLVLIGMLVGTLGCGSDELAQATANEPIEVWSTWSAASGGDGEALDAAILEYQQQYSGAEVRKSAASVINTTEDLRGRFQAGAPPDVFQTNGGAILCAWVTSSQSFVEDLDAFAGARGWTDPNVMPQVLQDMIQCVGPDGARRFYAIPVVIHRWNTLFFNRDVFAQVGIETPPESIEEFFQIADRLKQDAPDIAPLALGTTPMQGGAWPLATAVMVGLLSGMQGADWYLQFYQGQADLSSPSTEDSTKLREVLDAAARMLTYVNTDFQTLGWSDAAELVHAGKAAMTVLGDWVNGSYISAGWSATDGFGGRAAFGDVFVMGIDTLGVSRGAQNRTGAMNFLTTMASTAGQDAFNRIKGGIPPRGGELESAYNDYARGMARDFWAAGDRLVPTITSFVPADWIDAVWAQFDLFQVDKDVDQLMLVIRNNYGKLRQ
ncbi:ABC transporter substrate-binding protein [Myxococcota bacterium]